MGVFHFTELQIHDDELERFIALASEPFTLDGSQSDWEFGMRPVARYIALMMIDRIPELAEIGTPRGWTCPDCGDVMPPGYDEDDHLNCNHPADFGTEKGTQ